MAPLGMIKGREKEQLALFHHFHNECYDFHMDKDIFQCEHEIYHFYQ